MDKSLILAVAGSGKTSLLVGRLNEQERFLILTYTKNNFADLRSRVMQQFGCLPENIRLHTYFEFLYGFCFKPLLGDVSGCKGIDWDSKPSHFIKQKDPKYYFTDSGYLYHNRIAKLLDANNCMDEVKGRISKYFDHILIDEVQDFGGHDFDFLCTLASITPSVCLVGDFYQHTYSTSQDGNKRSSIYNSYDKYLNELVKVGYHSDNKTLSRSYRCSPTVCNFVQENLGIRIESHRTDETNITLIDDHDVAEQLFQEQHVVKLFYQDHHKYPCYSENWGKSKGQDHYQDVCVVMNPGTDKAFRSGKLNDLAPLTKSKLYVACTRSRGDLYLLPDKFIKGHKEK